MSGTGECRSCEEKKASKSMTRGEFLGAGVGVAAAAAVLPADLSARRQVPDCRGVCRPESVLRDWQVPAGILNALWGHAWPRLVAQAWAGIGSIPMGSLTVAELRAAVDGLKIGGVTSPIFDGYMNQIIAYLGNTTFSQIPVRVMGSNGFDFVISNKGLDLFVPPEPRTIDELVLYYMYRQTGRPSLGVPFYMVNGTGVIGMDGPTGPSEVQVDPLAVQALLVRDGVSTQCSDEIIRCLQMHQGPGDRRSISLETYQCLLDPTRCWQLSGAVLRGILTELPRVVATAWMERITHAPPDTVPDASYSARFADGADSGLRSIFRERLETSLPDRSRMRFEQDTAMSDDGSADVLITNQGIYFPPIPSFPAGDPLMAMYSQMREGKAGNPVFTDSRRTL